MTLKKQNRRLIYAWGAFSSVVLAFFVGVEVLYRYSPAPPHNYQYRILISDDMNVPEEKPDIDPNVQRPQKKKNLELDLYENTKHGVLPRISPDGMRVLDAYAARSEVARDAKKIKVAIVLGDEKHDDLNKQLEKLKNFKVSFVVPHYLENLQKIVDIIQSKGHEVFIQLPTQNSIPATRKSTVSPFLANTSPEDILLKLDYLLASAKHTIGIANTFPTLLTKSKKDIGTIWAELEKRGLAFLDVEKIEDADHGVVCFSDFMCFDKSITNLSDNRRVLIPLGMLDEFIAAAGDMSLVAVTNGDVNAGV